jgi:hypothetical protein
VTPPQDAARRVCLELAADRKKKLPLPFSYFWLSPIR